MVSLSLSRPYSKQQSKPVKKENKLSKWELENVDWKQEHFIQFTEDKYYAMGTISRKGFGRMLKGSNYYVIISGKNNTEYKVISRHDNKDIAVWNLTNATKEPMLNDLIAALKPKKHSKHNVMDLAVRKPIKATSAIAELAAMHYIDKNPNLQDGLDKGDFKNILAIEKKRFEKRLERKEFKVIVFPDMAGFVY